MIDIKFVNTTTTMPFDKTLESYFYEKFDKKTFKYSEEKDFYDDLLVFFVSERDINKKLNKHKFLDDNLFNPDCLGVYISYDFKIKKDSIYICPEKIMKSAFLLQQQYNLIDELSVIYKVLLTNILLHELAHTLMSNRDKYLPMLYKNNWKEIVSSMNKENQIDKYLFKCYSDENYYRHLRWDKKRLDLNKEYSWYKSIEETLANIYAISHNFTIIEKEIISKFIALQPVPYNYAVTWGKILKKDMLQTMYSWKKMKDGYLGLNDMAKLEQNDNFGRFELLKILEENFCSSIKCEKIDFEKLLLNYFVNNYEQWKTKLDHSNIFGMVQNIKYIIYYSQKNDKNFDGVRYYLDWIELYKEYGYKTKESLEVQSAYSAAISYFYKIKDLIKLDALVVESIKYNKFSLTSWNSVSSLNKIVILAVELKNEKFVTKYKKMMIKFQ